MLYFGLGEAWLFVFWQCSLYFVWDPTCHSTKNLTENLILMPIPFHTSKMLCILQRLASWPHGLRIQEPNNCSKGACTAKDRRDVQSYV